MAQHKFAVQYVSSGSVIYASGVRKTVKRVKVEETGKQLGGTRCRMREKEKAQKQKKVVRPELMKRAEN